MFAVSYAEITAKGPKQTAEEASAPSMPEVVSTEDQNSSSTPSVRTVSTPPLSTTSPSTAANPFNPPPSSSRAAYPAPEATNPQGTKPSHVPHSLVGREDEVPGLGYGKGGMRGDGADGSGGALGLANLSVVVGVSAVLGFKAWGLWERGQLGWRELGIGAGILGAVGVAEMVVGRCIASMKSKGKK